MTDSDLRAARGLAMALREKRDAKPADLWLILADLFHGEEGHLTAHCRWHVAAARAKFCESCLLLKWLLYAGFRPTYKEDGSP